MTEGERSGSNNMRRRIGGLLAADLDRGSLLKELSFLAAEPDFEECADLWAPALYERDANFFERFLLRHLSAREAGVIRSLLPRIEADGHGELFHDLYGRVITPEEWNADLLALAGSGKSDGQVLAAVMRRRPSGYWFQLDAGAALALYRRNPTLFGDFIADLVQGGPETSEEDYAGLLEEAKQHGDENYYWRIFRQVAGPDEWTQAARELLAASVPPEAILPELRRRHPAYVHDLDASVLAELLETYGAVVLPYIEENADWISRKGASQLLLTAEKLEDEALYWRIFFRVGKSQQWNAALLKLAEQPLAEQEWAAALRLRTPPADTTGYWSLEAKAALALYRRDPALSRPLIEQWIEDVSVSLFQEAERLGDEDLLNIITTRLVWDLAWTVYEVYPTESERQYKKPNAQSRAELEEWGRVITGRLDRLYAASPSSYVESAARILSRLDRSGSGWSFRRNLDRNPAFTYLYRQHHAAWLAVPVAVRDLLETPHPIAQATALEILREPGPEAADRTVENLPLLGALLLGDSERGVKKRVLAVLEQAAQQSTAHTAAILPTLHEAMYFYSKQSVADQAMVSYVRLQSRHSAITEESSSPVESPAQP
jgi:hypothetical protein